jgi:hypothetical protein
VRGVAAGAHRLGFDVDGRRLLEAGQPDPAVGAQPRRDVDAAVDRERQHVAAVVVQVRTHEVDAARREEHPRAVATEPSAERGADAGCWWWWRAAAHR